MVYLQTCRCRGKIYLLNYLNNFVYTFLVYSFYILFSVTKKDTYLKKFYWKFIDFFFFKWYRIDILQLLNVYVKNWYIYLK